MAAGRGRGTGSGRGNATGDAPADNDDSLQALEEAISELGGSQGVVRVLKHDPEGNTLTGMSQCCRMPIEGFDAYQVAEDYGPGKYVFEFVGPDGKYLRKKTASFMAKVRHAEPAKDAPGSPTDALTLILAEREKQSNFLQQMLLTMIQNHGSQSPAPAMDLAGLVSVFREGREAATPATSTGSDVILEALRTGAELAGSGSSEGGGSDLLSSLAPKVVDFLDRSLPAKGALPPASTAPTSAEAGGGGSAPGGALPPQADAHQVQNGEDPMQVLLKQYVPAILREAAAGHDAYTWGVFVAERTPPVLRESLCRIAYLDPGERSTFLANFAPELIPYGDWVGRACEGIREVYKLEDETPANGENDAATSGGELQPPAAPAG